MHDFVPGMMRNCEFLRQKNWKNEITLRNNPYSLVHNCEGKTAFEHLYENPSNFRRFNESMKAADSMLVTTGLYPFTQELGPLASDDTVTLVDIGGGRGHVIRQIKETEPDLKGRFILQDQASVIENNGDEIQKYGIEAMGHDFFKPQPVKGTFIRVLSTLECLEKLKLTDIFILFRSFGILYPTVSSQLAQPRKSKDLI